MIPGAGRWPEGRQPAARMALAAALGALGAYGLAPTGLWPLTLLMLLALPALLASCAGARQAALVGWALGAGWFGNGLDWIVEPFFVDPDRHAWMAPFALLFMAGGLALFWGAAGWAAWRAGRDPGGRVWALLVALPAAEFARAYVLTGFPWAGLAQVWVDTGAARLLAWTGPHGLALASLAIALPPGLALARRAGAGRLALSLLPALAFGAAVLAVVRADPPVAQTGATVRLVQPNARQDRKWDPEYIPVYFRRQIEYTAAGPRPDLVVWPESALPVLLNEAGPAFETIAEAAGGAPVVLGIQRLEGRRVYNSLVYLDETGAMAGLYDKHHLVPFGEYVPLGNLAAQAGIVGFAAQQGQGYSAGPGPRVLDLGRLGAALPLICYEAVFPQDVAGADRRADMLLQITNDAWFGAHSGPYQHLAQARMRAIEQGLPMIRAANTGVSALIDPLGRVVASIPLGQAGFADAPLPAPLPATFYARYGEAPVVLLLLLVAIALGVVQIRRQPIR